MTMSKDQLKNLECIQLRELDDDHSINLVEHYYSERLGITWVDIINYVYDKIFNCKKIMRLRVKELFLEEYVDEKLNQLLESKAGEINE